MQDDLNKDNQELNNQEQRAVEEELMQKAKQLTKNAAKKGLKMLIRTALQAISTGISALVASAGPILIGILIALVLLAPFIGIFFSIFFTGNDMNTEGGAEFWFPIAKEDIYDQYFVDGDKEAGALIPYEDSSTDKVRTVITSPMGPRNRNADNYTITWEEFNALSSAEQENYHRPGHTVQGDQHAGIDIGSAKLITGDQTEIIASQSGTVTFAGNANDGYGNRVDITSDPSYAQESMTRYAHMSQILVEEGEYVSQGQVVGIIGNTGGPYGIHLHFEIRQDGKVIDPRTKIEWDDPWRVGGVSLEFGDWVPGGTHEEFIAAVAPYAIVDMERRGIYASVTIAQAIIESGWGNDSIAVNYKNFFGMKSFSRNSSGNEFWDGSEVNLNASEGGTDYFRVYDSLKNSVYDHGLNFIVTSTYREHGVLECVQNNLGPKEQLRRIAISGYAVNRDGSISKPDGVRTYDEFLYEEFIVKWDLEKYDKMTVEDLLNSSSGNNQISSSNQTNINRMLKEATRIANDNSYYYSGGGNGPRGYDCSGFTQYLYRTYLGINLPRNSEEQASYMSAYRIPVSQAQPGDLLWHSGHVGIYYGNGQSVEAMGTQWGICFGNASRFTYAYSLSRYFANH